LKNQNKKKKKEAPKKEAPKPAPESAPAAKWSPPDLKFTFYDFKTELCNSKDIGATL